MGNDGSLTFDTKILTDGFSAGVNKLGSIAKSGLAVLGTAVAGSVAAFGALTKASLDSVASLEQNIGGVETLFKKSSDTVIANAKKAYETAGLSANDYMSTVTSFSASLLQSLGGDTKKAADYADRAIVDMSDNANKMGTSMESIQNAYQGFAKQNYTMLDNLKLGYGGTKEEMQRLVKDASKMTDAQKELGVTVDESSLSFGNIVNAISVMQKSMGIAGTTAKEAATTIEGSMNSAKAACDNFMNGTISAEDFAKTINVAAENIVNNLEEIIPRLVQTIPIAAGAIFDQLTSYMQEHSADMIQSGSQLLTGLVSGIAQSTPAVIDAGADVIDTLIQNIESSVPDLSGTGMQIVDSLVSGIVRVGGSLLSAGTQIVSNLLSGLSKSAPSIAEQAGVLISSLVSGIQSNVPQMLTAAADAIASFASGIGAQLPQLVPQALQMVVTLADAVISNIPTIVNAGISLLTGLVQGIINSLPTLISEGPRIINEFADAIYGAVGQLITTAGKLIVEFGKGLIANIPLIKQHALDILMAIINMMSLSKMLSLGKSLISSLGNGIKSMFGSISSAGSGVISSLVNGIKALATHPVTTIKGIATNALNAFKSINWSSVGSNIISGIVNGLKAGAGAIISAAKNVAKSALDSAKKFLGIKSPSRRFRDEVGKMMALGMGSGFTSNMKEVNTEVEGAVDKTISLAKKRINTTSNVNPSISVIEENINRTSNTAKANTNNEPGILTKDVDSKVLADRLAERFVGAMKNMGVYMDSVPVGKLVTGTVIDEMGRIGNRRT